MIEGQPLPRWIPKPFTPDLIELNASMSDLVGGAASNGRTQNGGSRAAGPVPQPFADDGGRRVRTPTDIMRDRQNREARKRAETERRRREEEQRQAEDEENVDPDIIAAAGGAPSVDTTSYRRSGGRRSASEPTPQEPSERRPGDRGSSGSRATIPSMTQPAASNGRTEKIPAISLDAAAEVTT